MSWMNCVVDTPASRAACRSWFALVLSDDMQGPVRVAIHETEAGRETELRAVFINPDGQEREFRRRRQKGGFTIDIRPPTKWPVR